MDYNDINLRLERLYLSINKKFEDNVLEHMQTKEITDGKKFTISITFDAKHNENETFDRINNIISNLANLKDHLKTILEQRGGDAQKIEDEINQNLSLQVILDLHNQEKHCYPLTKTKRSGKDPKIINISKAISSRPGVKATAFIRDPITGAGATNNMAIVITADVVDNQGNLLYGLSDLIDKSLNSWETIITKYNLI